MRPLEIVLLVANLVAFAVQLVPLRGRAGWLLHLAVLPPMAAIAQVLVEDARRQMVPAYGLAAALFLAWLLKAARPAGRTAARGLARRLAAGVAVGLCALALAVSIALPAILPVFRFPPPGGPYAIGTVTYHRVDGQRHEMFSADPAAHRELMAQVWDPAGPSASSARAPYVPNADALSSADAPQLHLPGFALDYWSVVPCPGARIRATCSTYLIRSRTPLSRMELVREQHASTHIAVPLPNRTTRTELRMTPYSGNLPPRPGWYAPG
jgi:hypothetical protein